MQLNFYYCLFVGILSALGISELMEYLEQRKQPLAQQFRSKSVADYGKTLLQKMEKQTDVTIFRKANIPITADQYNVVRLAITGAILIIGTLKYLQNPADLGTYLATICVAMAFFALTTTRQLWGFQSPVSVVVNKIQVKRQKTYDAELYKAIGQLKNICITQQSNARSADYIIENLLRYTKATKPIFAQVLSMFRFREYDAAVKFFSAAIGTKLARDFISILIKLDDIDPAEFVEQLTLFQDAQREKRMTERLNEQEAYSVWMYIPAIANCFIILLNTVILIMLISMNDNILSGI